MIHFEQDKALLFDDSFNHEAWHNGPSTRINLIIDFWHPELSDAEVDFFATLHKARLAGDLIASEDIDPGNHIYTIVDKARHLLKSNDDWWIN